MLYTGLSMILGSFVIFMAVQFGTVAKGIMAESNNFSHTQDIVKNYRNYNSFDNTEIEVVELEYLIDKTRGNTSVFIFTNRNDWLAFMIANDGKLTKSPISLGIDGTRCYSYSKKFNTPQVEYDILNVDSKLMSLCGGSDVYLTRKFSSSVMYGDGGEVAYVAAYLVP